ncbi:hypothetical protein BH10CHL1_BH10CHL1_15520 [soil metagenome]
MRLSVEHLRIIGELARGSRLKDHRNLDGDKVYKLHPLGAASVEIIDANLVTDLKRQQLIASNMKFPAATYLLTDKGLELSTRLALSETLPLGAKNYPATS